MASLGDLDIAQKESNYNAGGAFVLEDDIEVDETHELRGNWIVDIDSDSGYIAAQTTEDLDSDDVSALSLEAAQSGLDILAVAEKIYGGLSQPYDEYLTWWKEDEEQKLRIVSTLSSEFDTEVSVSVSGEEEPEDTEINWHPSFRYFRLSQSTDDLISAYRNMFLALEMLLSSEILNYSRPERDWLENALDDAGTHPRINLQNFLITNNTVPDVSSEIIDEQWTQVRNAIFHAKKQEATIRPQSPHDRDKVEEALNQLSRLYISLTSAYLDVKIPTGGITHQGFAYIETLASEASEIRISNMAGKPEADECLEDSKWEGSIGCEASQSSQFSGGGVKATSARFKPSDVSISTIRRYGLCGSKDGELHLLTVGLLESDLELDGIDSVEIVQAHQMRNRSPPRLRYQT